MRKIMVLTLVVLILTTASAFVPIPPITEDCVSQDIAEADPPDLDFPTIWEPPYINMSLAGEGDLSSDSILGFAETAESNVGLDPDSDTNADAVYSEWDFSETVDPDTWHYPDTDTNNKATANSSGAVFPWASGALSDTYVNNTDCLQYYHAGVWPESDAYVEFEFDVINAGGASVSLEGYAYTRLGVESLDIYWQFWDGSSWDTKFTRSTSSGVFYSVDIEVGTGYVHSSMVKLKVIRQFDGGGWTVDYRFDYLNLMVERESYAESFADVSDWSFDSESAGLPSRSFTTDGDVLTFEIGYDDGGNEWAKYDAPISVSRGDFIEVRFICSATAGAYKSTRLNLILDATTIFGICSSTWITQRFLISDYCTVAPTEIKLYIDDYANVHASDTGYVMFDYIRIGSVMGWGHDGSTTEATSKTDASGFASTWTTDGDKATWSCTKSSGVGTYSNAYIVFDTTTTAIDLESDYYSWYEIAWEVTVNSAAGGGFWATVAMDGYRPSGWGGIRISNGATGSGIARGNTKESDTVAVDNRVIFTYTCGAGDTGTLTVEIDYTRVYGFNNWTYNSVTTNEKTTAVAYYDSGEDALVMEKTFDTSADYFDLKTRNQTIGYDISDMVLLVTVKASANTSCRLRVWTFYSEGNSGTQQYFLYDDYQTIAVPITSPATTMTQFRFYLYDWATATPSSGSYSIYIKDNVTMRPSWYDASGESETFGESFADVSDCYVAGGASPSVSTNGDYCDFQDTSAGSQIWPHLRTNEPSITVSGTYYFEIRWKMSVTTWITAKIHTQDDSAGTLQTVYNTNLGTDWTITKSRVTLSVIEHIDIYPTWTPAETRHLYIDYIRIAPATELGWQDDCSSINGYARDTSGVITNDGDIVHISDTDAAAQGYRHEDFDIKLSDYPFLEVRWKAPASQDIRFQFYDENSVGSWPSCGTGDGTWQTTRFNVLAQVAGDYLVDFMFYDETNNLQDLYIDYIKFYSIANWSIVQSGVSTDDYLYVDSNVLYGNVDSGYIQLNDDPSLSINGATYNVWNITIGGSPPEFRHYDGAQSAWSSGETRGTSQTGTITGCNVKFESDGHLSAIKFWEDSTAPTISTFTNTPLDPNMASTVTIETISSDGQGIYTVEVTAVVEPSGSNIGTVSMALDYTTQGGAEIWSYEFSAGDLSEGRYTFELDVSDATNSAYEYLTFTVGADTQTIYIRIFDSLGDFVPFETFEVYRNDSRQYTDTFEGNTEYAYQIQVKDRWGESLNTTTFTAGEQELVVTVEVYSLKVMSWHYDFVRFNITRAGLTYSEIVTPLEIINFRLYTNTYDWAIDYLNGSSASGNINLTNSTALIVTGNTISDVYGLVTTVNDMTTAINITTTTISNEVVTVQLMFDWSNTTLYNQSITIIAAFNWENTTLYNQTISIASLFNATNTVLYDQIILIQNMFNWENTTLFNQTMSILNAFNSTNTVIYTQTVSILADISNVNSTIYAQTVQMLLDLENNNSTLYTQTVTLLANIANIDSDIAAQTVTILADIENVNSTIYAQTVQVLTDISNVNSTLYAQTVTLLSNLENVNSTIYTQTVSILSQLVNMNSTIYSQTLTILSNLSELNVTIFLVDDPTHLNPLIIGHSYSDVYCDFTIVTNWHNATLSIYDNDVLRTGPTSELLCPIRYPLLSTSGTHNLSVFVDGGNDSFWYNISYTVAEIIAFELEEWDVTPHLGVENYLECFFRTTWENSTIYVYLNNSLQTSVLEQEGGISFSFWMTGNPGLHQYVFNVTSGAEVKTITWDFYMPDWAETGLVVRWDMWTFQNNYTLIMLESNWMNCTYYVYLNSSLVATSYNDPVTLNFTREMNVGIYNLTIHAYGGTQNYTISNIRYIVTEEGVSYDYSSVTGGRVTIVGDTYEGDTYGDTYENPTGAYFDQETVAIIAVGGFLIMFTAFLVAREIKQRDREKTERKYSQ